MFYLLVCTELGGESLGIKIGEWLADHGLLYEEDIINEELLK